MARSRRETGRRVARSAKLCWSGASVLTESVGVKVRSMMKITAAEISVSVTFTRQMKLLVSEPVVRSPKTLTVSEKEALEKVVQTRKELPWTKSTCRQSQVTLLRQKGASPGALSVSRNLLVRLTSSNIVTLILRNTRSNRISRIGK